MLTFILSHINTVINICIVGLCGVLTNRILDISKRAKAMELGIQAQLRDSIKIIYKAHIGIMCMPLWEKDNLQQLYIQYRNLGGNGTITQVVKELMELPVPECGDVLFPSSECRKTPAVNQHE